MLILNKIFKSFKSYKKPHMSRKLAYQKGKGLTNYLPRRVPDKGKAVNPAFSLSVHITSVMEDGLASIDISESDTKLHVPCTMMMAGPAMTGKSTNAYKLMKAADVMFDDPPKSMIYAYGTFDERINSYTQLGAIPVAGVPTDELLRKVPKPCMVFLDDLMTSIREEYLIEFFTVKVHHYNLIGVYITQNLFDKKSRVPRMNSQYLFVMKSLNSKLHIRTLGSQLFPGKGDYFRDAFEKATEGEDYGYIFIDLHPKSNKLLRLRSHIFPGENMVVYLPKGG